MKNIQMLCVGAVAVQLLALSGCVTEQAKERAKQKPDEGAKSVESLVYDARAHFSIGKYDQAEETMQKVVQQQPEDTRHLMLMANIQFIAGKIQKAIESYDQVIRLKPEMQPDLWQRGMALYYAGEYQSGKEQFEKHQAVNSQDVENAVWHLLCTSHVADLESARKKMIPIEGDTRIPMKEVYEMFAGRMEPEQVIEAATDSADLQQSLYYAYLYNGLYYEMLGDKQKCIEAMTNAEKAKLSMARDNLMNQVATIHLRLRTADQNETENKQ